MSLLFRIVYAGHANGTHHKLALDALRCLRLPNSEAWQRLFLKHADLYMEGSKAPDVTFKDFKNHVLHVRDNYWGGAPEKVENWYGHVVSALQAQNWSEAVYAAGVLSHYYTDPIHPFHTGQTEAENNIHRAVEWSINRSYDSLKQLGEQTQPVLAVPVATGDRWLREMTLAGAEFSNRYYEKLIAHYDISRGVVDPPAGLDPVGRTLVAELLVYAARSFARVLDRALEESGQTPPEVTLTAETVMAGLKIPMKALQKRLQNAADREQVQRMYDELRSTGTVDKTLAEDDRMVRDLHAAEVVAPREREKEAARQMRLTETPAAAPSPERAARSAALPAPPAPATGGGGDAAVSATPSAAVLEALDAWAREVPVLARMEFGEVETAANDAGTPDDEVAEVPAEPAVAAETPVERPTVLAVARSSAKSQRIHLNLDDDIERAPSIGAKTAERLNELGVTTVAEFLDKDTEQLATSLGRRALTARVLADWQDQARLVMAVPGLRGTHAQLLVGAGYRTPEAIVADDPTSLCAAVAAFALTAEGQSILRNGDTPDIEKIRSWIESAARAVEAA